MGTIVACPLGMDRAKKSVIEEETRTFAIAVVKMHRALRAHPELWNMAGQLTRAASSVAANNRAMSRARSVREFAAKLHIVHEEADEAAHWLGMIKDSITDPLLEPTVTQLLNDAIQLRNLFGRARATTRRRHFCD